MQDIDAAVINESRHEETGKRIQGWENNRKHKAALNIDTIRLLIYALKNSKMLCSCRKFFAIEIPLTVSLMD